MSSISKPPQNQQPAGIAAYRTKQDIVYDTMKNWIIFGELQADERMTIRDLAARLGVSETPVRVALTRLASEGFVDHTSHIGARVAAIRDEDVEDIQSIIAVLQGLAAYRAAERITSADAARLRSILDELESMSDNASPVEMSSLNTSFHRLVSELSAIPILTEFVDQLLDRLQRGNLIWKSQSHREKARQEHRDVLQAIEAKRPAEARALMEQHWLRSARDFTAQIAERRTPPTVGGVLAIH